MPIKSRRNESCLGAGALWRDCAATPSGKSNKIVRSIRFISFKVFYKFKRFFSRNKRGIAPEANKRNKKKGTASRRYPSSVHLMLNRFRFYNSLRQLARLASRDVNTIHD